MQCCLQVFRKSQKANINNERIQESPVMVEAPETTPKYLSNAQEPPCLISGSLSRFVKVPQHLDHKEWLAAHTYEFFHLINAYYGCVSSLCTMESCPIMRIRSRSGLNALIWPPDFVMATKEGHASKGSLTTMFFSASNTLCREISAANYVDSALTWIETQLENTDRFPKSINDEYPSEFEKKLISPIFQLLFHILAHIYDYHYDTLCEFEQEAHINGLLAHFVTFGNEFGLFGSQDLGPLGTLAVKLFPKEAELVKPANLAVRRVSEEKEPETK